MTISLATLRTLFFRKLAAQLNRSKCLISNKLNQDVMKFLDPVAALVIALVLSPLIVIRAIAGFCRCGQVFDKNSVTGLYGKTFNRLMFSCDYPGKELACLINIIKGDLAFVGPTINEVTNEIRLSVKPGLVSTYKIRKKVCIAHEDELTADMEYVYHKSLVGDMAIILRNIVSSLLAGSRELPSPYSVNFFDINVWNTSIDNAVKWILVNTQNKGKKHLAFVNPDCLNISFRNKEYKKLLQRVDHVLPDGIGLKIGCRMLNVALKENVNGTDMFPILCEKLVNTDLKMYLLGAKHGVAEKTAENMRKRYPGLKICGTHHGYFTSENDDKVIDHINSCKPDILLVAMGAPMQDLWIDNNLKKLNVHVAMGVGGLFDFYSGMTKRAPRWVREMGMEWSWRILQDPARMWKRYIIGNPLFLYRVWRYGDNTQHGRDFKSEQDSEIKPPENTSYITKCIKKNLWIKSQKLHNKTKRIFDIVASGCLLITLTPIMLLTALAVKIESSGPVLFSQKRIGRNGKAFTFWKFRSMYIDAEERKQELINNNDMQGGVLFKMRKDPRITAIGRFIRKTSIDELPQLWNVLTGDMSLVGPRPCLPCEADKYSVTDRYRLESAPGITCIWQISGRSDIPFEKQVEMDIEYINNASLENDLNILLKTVPAVFSGRGAY